MSFVPSVPDSHLSGAGDELQVEREHRGPTLRHQPLSGVGTLASPHCGVCKQAKLETCPGPFLDFMLWLLLGHFPGRHTVVHTQTHGEVGTDIPISTILQSAACPSSGGYCSCWALTLEKL